MRSFFRLLACIAVLGLAACGKSPDVLLNEARAIKEKGDRGAAILQVKSLLQEHPDHIPSRLFLGLLYSDAADYAGAEKELRRALDGQADPAQVLPALAKAILMQGEAKKVLAEIPPDKVSDVGATAKIHSYRGSAHLVLRQIEEARKSFDQALAAKPGAPEALVGMARILAAERKWDDALAEVAKALQSDPKDADALLLQGDLLRATGKGEAAEESYKSLVAAHPSHVSGLLALVSMTISGNRLDEASSYVASVRKASPGNPMVAYFQALIAFRKNDFKAARDSIGAVLKVAPNHLPSVLLGGAIEFALGSQELAQTRLKYVLDRAPNNLYARRVLAASYTRAGQTQKALETLEPALKSGVKDPAIFALAGEVHMQMNDFDRAKRYFEQASALDPGNARMRTGLGLSRLASGDIDSATADLESAAQLDTTRNQADVLLVSTYLQRRQFDQALKAAESLVAKQPTSPVGYNLIAASYLGKGDEDSAREALLKALEVQPNFVPAASNLAQLDIRRGDKKAARKRFEDILVRDKQSMQAYLALATFAGQIGATREEITGWLDVARKENPGAIQPMVMLARLYFLSGEPKKAFELVEKALASAPNSPDILDLAGQVQLAAGEKNRALATFSKLVTLQPTAVSFFRMANAQLANEDFAGAVKALKSALEFRPQFLEAQLLLIKAQSRTNQTTDALKTAAQLQKQNPRAPDGWIAEGDVHMQVQHFASAVKAYEKALAAAPSGAVHMRLYTALAASGKANEGEEKLRRWIKRNPADFPARLYLAEQLTKNGNYKEAAEQYEALASKMPGNVVVLNNLAWAYLQLKDKRSMEMAEKALKLQPNNAAIMDTFGLILVAKGDLTRGVEVLGNAAKMAPKSPEIRYHYVQALAKNGDRTSAREELERLLIDFPEFTDSKSAFGLLAELRRG